ncbi:mechanosensitive ion channel family protein [Persephonella atlantica]|uniref:Mechanosensitive ion channel family protein n=1 Tax=Persephonella atlantica TaxID=2699429 RepID=A0ABS1GFA7_9AQUI|nr:mechanosensitive ion channel family protein [Persephonella atlantica]MBK3331613.1 mechanosensitive ion channel family protein [Persephonella atlantica]
MDKEILSKIDQFLNQIVLGTPLYKWALAFVIFILFLLFRKIFSRIIVNSIKAVVSRTKTTIDDKILSMIESPLRFLFIVIGLWIVLDILSIQADIAQHIVRSMFIILVFWIFYNGVNVFSSDVYKFTQKFGKELAREVGSFLIKSVKVFIVVIAVLAVLQEWGINVTALIASLGIGGLAIALAAKDTAANLFGGLTILADKSLKIGEWVRVGSVEGIVEDLGMRTTKIRTFEKSLITVPNQYIANNPIENFSRRDIRRIMMTIGLVYSTPPDTVRKIVKEIKQMLQEHPGIAKDQTMLVFFDKFSDSSLDIFIYAFTNTANWIEYMAIKEEINLKIMDIVEKNGSSFAFPSQSIYVEKFPEKLTFYRED